jgi:response regulator RpfG family c-di-GMP phosphodiesterase
VYETARAEIVRYAGRQFDPGVVDAWLRVKPEEWQRIRRDLETQGELEPFRS